MMGKTAREVRENPTFGSRAKNGPFAIRHVGREAATRANVRLWLLVGPHGDPHATANPESPNQDGNLNLLGHAFERIDSR